VREAIESFHAAEAVCLQLDEGPSLTFVYGNLGLLYSKIGNFDAMERAFAAARKLTTGAGAARATSGKVDIGRREELFHEHHRGWPSSTAAGTAKLAPISRLPFALARPWETAS